MDVRIFVRTSDGLKSWAEFAPVVLGGGLFDVGQDDHGLLGFGDRDAV